ncbi:MAG TPA: type II toxin-antitoxin system HicB family antitoxin [bacterium]|nr:type II toxin-antitoxin system HicB family antitoxin [bacterium]
MSSRYTLEYWIDEGWYIGRIKEIPGVFSQGETLSELKENVKNAYDMMLEESTPACHPATQVHETEFEL